MKYMKIPGRMITACLLISAILLSGGCASSASEQSTVPESDVTSEAFGQKSAENAEAMPENEVISAEEAVSVEVSEFTEEAISTAEEASSAEEMSAAEENSAVEEESAMEEEPEASEETELEPTTENNGQKVGAAVQTDTLSQLEQQIDSMVSSFSGTWSVYLKRLDTGESFAINDSSMVAASLIKLYVYGTAAQQIENGILSDSYYSSTMLPMINVSDNTACNTLIDVVGGMSVVNDFIAEQGWTQSQLNRKMLAPDPVENYTSVSECGDLLERVYNGTYVSATVSENLLDAMLSQTRRGKIPAGLPTGTKCANKTGELSDVENDVAIVYGPTCAYILCVMSDGVSSGNAQSNIASISGAVYNYLNP